MSGLVARLESSSQTSPAVSRSPLKGGTGRCLTVSHARDAGPLWWRVRQSPRLGLYWERCSGIEAGQMKRKKSNL